MADEVNRDWIGILHQITGLAQSGLHYSQDIHDQERYLQLLGHVEQLLKVQQVNTDCFQHNILQDVGYATPKIDVRAVVFKDRQLLLVKESSDGRWSLPGGWADSGYSAAENTVKEVLEETGLHVRCQQLMALTDMRKHPHPQMFLHVYKVFFRCEILGGTLKTSAETTDLNFFSLDNLPELSTARVTYQQIKQCFDALDQPSHRTYFD
ncbi:ADP-ribose pyrophosphatase YjhB (NUDIX family) [Acinetobacter calcoaceticus]|uniref:ADP-ribose pyrophosphatase YjhB (NUDIX family) n=1 Tax=Acinetobacter calcoaceticus TaxID=471 RepID=A0A4R1XK52_ACICA|nr:ADP-ribose pyrophosphatase YjhB (NUDIX family) [Acinetobacter calcoaceticus]